MPIASEPAIPIPATLSVFFRPCQKSGRCSRMKCQSMLARRLKSEWSGRARVAAAPCRCYLEVQSETGSFPNGYVKRLFGRGTVPRKLLISEDGAPVLLPTPLRIFADQQLPRHGAAAEQPLHVSVREGPCLGLHLEVTPTRSGRDSRAAAPLTLEPPREH